MLQSSDATHRRFHRLHAIVLTARRTQYMTAADGKQGERVTPEDLQRGSSAFSSDWLTAEEAAAYLKVNHRTLCQWAKQGKIPGHPLSGRVRRTWRFSRRELDIMLSESA